ncbi:hypothetical protein BRADI_4g26605v3, partial [Brachypodium distachyon]
MVHLEELHHQVAGAGGHDEHQEQQQQLIVAVVDGGGEEEKKKKEKEKHEVVPQLRFPPGFRFVPSDLELMDVFLRGKIDGRKLPLEVVFFEVPILNWEPDKLVEARKAYGTDRWYFFTKWEQSTTNKAGEPRRKLHDVDATWKATGSRTTVRRGSGPAGVVVGTKKLLTYHVGGDVGNWSMHEYLLDGTDQMDQFVLCTIQEKVHCNGKRRKRPAKELLPKRKKEEAAASGSSQSQSQSQQQPEQEETTAYYSDPLPPPLSEHGQYYDQYHLAALQEEDEDEEFPMELEPLLPLLEHRQYYHPQASLQEEHAVAFGADPLEGYLDGDHHDYPLVDVATEEEDTLAYNGFGALEPPLMMPQDQHGYQALLLEEMNIEYYMQQLDRNQGQQSMWGQNQISSQVNEYTCWHGHHLYQQSAAQKTGTLEDMFGCPDTVLQEQEPLSHEAPSGDDTRGDLVFLVNGNNGGKDARMASHVCQHGGEGQHKSTMDM